jgi:uncharacterized membrane protein (DUF373 family)
MTKEKALGQAGRKSLTVQISQELATRMRVYCARKGIQLREAMELAIGEFLSTGVTETKELGKKKDALTVYLRSDVHTALRVFCAENRLTIRAVVETAIVRLIGGSLA